MTTYKCRCPDCGWCGTNKDVLKADNPFNTMKQIYGCPACQSVERIELVCDEPNCWSEATCGFIAGNKRGYRRTCSKHYREAKR